MILRQAECRQYTKSYRLPALDPKTELDAAVGGRATGEVGTVPLAACAAKSFFPASSMRIFRCDNTAAKNACSQ